MGWWIMGTEHLRARTETDAADAAEKAIDFIEELGIPLLPWQAEALRSILHRTEDVNQVVVHRGDTVTPPPGEHIRKGHALTGVTLDESKVVQTTPGSETGQMGGMVRVLVDGEWKWLPRTREVIARVETVWRNRENTDCTCTFDNHGFGCPAHDYGDLL